MTRPHVLLLLTFILPLASFTNEPILNHPVPLLANKTLDGRTIDAGYYKGHVTVVSFMYIGCLPCMMEISTLNKLNADYKHDAHFQVLCIARQMREQMIQFNASDSSLLSMLRKTMKVDPMSYAILPGCDDTISKAIKEGSHVSLTSECNTLEEKFGVTAYPTIFYVDKNGLVRKIDKGGPGVPNDQQFYNKIKKEIDLLLAE